MRDKMAVIENSKERLKSIFKKSETRAIFALLAVMSLGLIFHADGAFLKWNTHRDLFRQVSVF